MKGQYLLHDLPLFLDHHLHSTFSRKKLFETKSTNADGGGQSAGLLRGNGTHRYLIHALGWTAVYFFWIVVFQKRAFALSRTATIEFCYLIFIAANFYFNIYFAIPGYLYRRKHLQFAVLFFAGIAIAAMLRVPLASYMNAHYFFVKPGPDAKELFIASFVNVFIWTTIIISAKLTYDHFRFEESMHLIKEEKSKAELDLLNAQLNPHFIFNSLNTIYGEIENGNSIARNLILSFSNMLRYQLYDCNHQQVLILDEVAYIENYVRMQRARLEEDVDVILTIEEQLGSFHIAPLLFISFLENAFKYAAPSELYGHRIEISFSRMRDTLFFRCFNTKAEADMTNSPGGGIGLYNTRKRLSLHYPGKHDLQIIDREEYFLIELTIEINEMEMHYRR